MSIAINDNPTYAQYIATDAQTSFIVSYPFAAGTDLNVYVINPASVPNDAADLVSPADYTVTGAGTEAGGAVTFNVGVTLNDIVTIVGNMPVDRTTVFPDLNSISTTLNAQLNDLTLMVKQLETNQNTTIPHYNNSGLIEEGDRYLPLLDEDEVWIGGPNSIQKAVIGGAVAPTTALYWVSEATAVLSSEVNLGLLTTGIIKHTVIGSVSTPATAIPGVDYYAPGGVVAIADGGTGATTATNALINLVSGTSIAPATISGTDKVIIQDANDADNIKTVTAQSIANLSGGLQWSVITADTTAVMNQGYIVNSAARVIITIPASFSEGDELRIVGRGSGGWELAPVSAQQIYFGESSTLTGAGGGKLQSTQDRDCVEILGVLPNTELTVMSAVGNITVV